MILLTAVVVQSLFSLYLILELAAYKNLFREMQAICTFQVKLLNAFREELDKVGISSVLMDPKDMHPKVLKELEKTGGVQYVEKSK